MSEPPRVVVGPIPASERARVAEILRSTGNFRDEEVDVALELFDESLASADYTFVGAFEVSADGCVASADGCRRRLQGFACYGPTMATDRTYDLYWIAVDRSAQGTGCGSLLLTEVERRLEALHARMLVVETSSRSDYTTTREFYLRRNYVEAARVREFYAPDDDRIILTKRFAGSPREGWGAVA
ncbi:MAG TPA: GNAT family N-acetyltransferase [Gemmatimonadaceae bacterium]|nr:GNAT family N-acetyltransferase [Gemmatimonadaceae bacterium]